MVILEIFGIDKDLGLTIKEQVEEVRKFTVHEKNLDQEGLTFGKVNLMLYIDKFGNFLERSEKTNGDKIAIEIFNRLSSEDKLNVLEYCDFINEDGE